MCSVKCIQELAMTSSLVGLRKKSKALPKAKLAPEKRSWSLFGWCADSLQLFEPQRTQNIWEVRSKINDMHRKLQCLQMALVKRMGPILLYDNTQLHITQPTLQKLNKLDYKVLPHPSYSSDLSPTNCHYFKHLNNFLQGKCFHNQQEE